MRARHDTGRLKRWLWLLLPWFALTLVLGGGVLRPVCVPLSADDLSRCTVPIQDRTDREFHVRVFQLREGRWHQCKTWLSRQFFF